MDESRVGGEKKEEKREKKKKVDGRWHGQPLFK